MATGHSPNAGNQGLDLLSLAKLFKAFVLPLTEVSSGNLTTNLAIALSFSNISTFQRIPETV